MPDDWTPPTTQPTTRASVTVSEAADLARYWQAFDDPTLASLIDRAIESNYDLRIATERIRQARAARGVVAAGLFPNANVTGAYTRSGNGGNRTVASDLYRAGLDASWELDIFGGVRRNVEAAEADIQGSVEDRRDVLVTLTAEVALDYLDLRGLQQQLGIAYENLRAQEYSADLTRRRQRGGFVSSLDVANAEAQVATTKSQIPLLEQNARQTIYAISVLLGREPAALLDELSADAPVPGVPPTVPVGLPSDLLKRRPDIRRAEAQIHAATARIGVATADLFPRFLLNGNIGIESAQPKGLLDWTNRFWSVGPSVSWPIFDAGRIGSNIQVQTSAQAQMLLTYRQTVLVALRDVESALVAYADEQRHRTALVDAVTANRRAVDISTRLYSQGQTDFLNVLSAQRSLFASQDALAQSDRVVAQNLVALYKALGGGWEQGDKVTR